MNLFELSSIMKRTLTILTLLSSCWCQAADYTFSSTGGEHGWWDADAWTIDGTPATWDNGGSTAAPENAAKIQSDTAQTITIDREVSLTGIDIIGTSGGDGTILQGSTGSETIHLGTGGINLHATSGNRYLKFKDVTLDVLAGATSTWNLAPTMGNWLVFEGLAQVTGSGTWALNFGSASYTLTLAATNGNNQVNASGFTGEILLQRGSLNINQTLNGNVRVASGATSTVSVGASGSFANQLILDDNATVCLNLNASGSFIGTIQRGSNTTLQLAGAINGTNLALPERGDFFNGNANLSLESGAENVIRSITTTSSSKGYVLINSQSESLTQYIDITLNNNNNNQGDLILTDTFIGKEAHIGNLAGDAANAQVRVDWGGGAVNEEARTLVVHQTQDATFAGKFTGTLNTGTGASRTSALTKRGLATLTLSGESTTKGLLRVAEGQVDLSGSWAGTAQVDDGATLDVSGTLGSTSAQQSYVVAEQGKVRLKGSGTIANSEVTVSVASASRDASASHAVLNNVSVTTEGIVRTSSTGQGTIENGHIGVTQTGAFRLGNVSLIDTLVDLQSSGSMTLDSVALSGNSAIQNTAGGSIVMTGSSSLTLNTGTAQTTGTLTYTPAGNATAITFAGLTTSQFSGVALASGATLTLDVANSLLCSEALAGQQYLAITLEGFAGENGDALDAGNFVLDSHLTGGFTAEGAVPSILGVESANNGGTVVYISFAPAMMPEPATTSLGLIGLAGLLLRRRRKA